MTKNYARLFANYLIDNYICMNRINDTLIFTHERYDFLTLNINKIIQFDGYDYEHLYDDLQRAFLDATIPEVDDEIGF